MTNKLRSMIEKLYEGSTTMTADTESTQLVYMIDATSAICEVLDAIIEEISLEAQELYETKNPLFMGTGMAFSTLAEKFKQAREELSNM
jgi:phosphoribosylaminoimidazole (AIR) synthetase